ncbi:pimeloyl-ACP methyl ester carboxylesterase [Rathayibacter sp. PhB93]|uniref:alpha/beta fold hydrolase n=1 Tax=unclassified Rathayibacter TaxID=2609250 RepID=UPI000F467B4E|nr:MULTISPECIES: alpha/beta hydrolase [unclassified Rathayibacter]ROQ02111.1 pimeloyl-ACP methyl ester carboxylesterase [Rathayibacter sp. PhB93]TDQ07816.1 pimeloyl-ACP methyl ester carboxylesterase [Rathayibacter sp. PhB1]
MPDFTTDDGVRLSWTEQGDPAGRPVVLIAGFKAPATSWKPQQGPLAEAGYRVISFDRRGHGLSERTEAGATMLRHGADLAQLLRHLDLRGAALVGGSMGGNSIWAFLAGSAGGTAGSTDESTDASRVDRIVIVDQTPRMLNGDDWPYGFYDYTEANRDTLFATTIPDPGRWSVASKGPVRIARLLKALGGGERRELTETERLLLNDHAKADWRPVIARTSVPVLFVAGRESEFWPAEHAAAAASLAPRGDSLVIEKDGHAANIEQPKAFTEALLEFLAR